MKMKFSTFYIVRNLHILLCDLMHTHAVYTIYMAGVIFLCIKYQMLFDMLKEEGSSHWAIAIRQDNCS